MILLVNNNDSVKLQKGALKGDDGGYYIPSVNEEGQLTWFPSEEGMPAVEGANIKGEPGEPGTEGKPGERGESGVYVGTTEPDDDSLLIWINPEGEPNDDIATKKYVDDAIANIEVSGGSVDLTGYATEEYVDNAIAEFDATIGFEDLTEEQKESLKGADGTRGTVIVPATFKPNANTTEVNGSTPTHYVGFMMVKLVMSKAGYSEAIVGDIFIIGSVLYRLVYMDESRAYFNQLVDTKGADGYTPQRTVDYWTEEDKTEIVEDIINNEEIATKDYVDEAIANSSTGGSGSDIKTVVVRANKTADLSDEVKAEIEEIWAYYKANGADAVAKKYRVVFSNTYNDSYSFIGTQWNFNSSGFYLYAGDCYTDTLTGYQSPRMYVTFNSDGSIYYCNCLTRQESGSGSNSGDGWTTTDELYGDNIYNAKEIFIRMKTDTNKWVYSHFICNPVFSETIGNSYNMEYISFTTPDGMDNNTPYWYFDGWNLNIVCGYSCSNVLVAYKS